MENSKKKKKVPSDVGENKLHHLHFITSMFIGSREPVHKYTKFTVHKTVF